MAGAVGGAQCTASVMGPSYRVAGASATIPPPAGGCDGRRLVCDDVSMLTMRHSLAGRLLVASPQLLDPNFHRTVIFICAHEAEGSLGLVLNRPLEIGAQEALGEWGGYASPPAALFVGGPVEPSTALGLGLARPGAAGIDWTAVTERVGLLDLSRTAAEDSRELEAVRLFGGHAGWGPGQLEAEIVSDDWVVVEAELDDPFTEQPERLWEAALERQPSPTATLPHMPSAPTLN